MKLLDASPKIYFGESALDALSSLPDGVVMLVCDPFMVKSGISKRVTSQLEVDGREYVIFSNVKPDPSVETVAECMQMVFHEKPESLIALGGGSAIDTTKAALFCCLRYKELLMGRQHIHKPFFVAIPTTSGTGSEVTSYTVLTDEQQEVKIPLSDRCMVPDIAILDPNFTKTLPVNMIAFTGMDVLTHAIEAYVSPNASTFTDMYAAKAAGMVLEHLPKLYKGDKSTEVHQEMMIASTLAGLAFNNAGLGISHGLAHTIGAEFHVPHGKANSIVLPYAIAYNAGLGRYASGGCGRTKARYISIGRQLGLTGNDDEVAAGLPMLVRGLNEMFDIKSGLKDNGVERQQFETELPEMVDKILADMTTQANPRNVTAADVRQLLQDIFDGTNFL